MNCENTPDSFFTDSTPDAYNSLLSQGWKKFEIRDYETAVELFQDAAERDAVKPEPYLGLGWSYARLMALEKSKSNFTKTSAFAFFDSLMMDTFLEETYAGLASVYFASQDYETAIIYADSLINRNNNFMMRHDTTINIGNIKLQKLYCNFYLNHISEVYTELIDMGYEFNSTTNETKYAQITSINELNGFHDANLISGDCESGDVITDISLIMMSSIHPCDYPNLDYSISSVSYGEHTFSMFGNPILSIGSTVTLSCITTENYGEFINEILSFLMALEL